MFVALVLVILLMQKAADPRVYQNFFAALGAPLTEREAVVVRGGVRGKEPAGDQRLVEGGQFAGGAVTVPDDGLRASPTMEAIQGVSDATIWQAGDSPVFYGLLAVGRRKSYRAYGDQLSLVGYGALSSQGQAYRGRWVGVHGQVVRCEPLQAEDNQAGIDQYWLIWVRPLDGSDRPVMLYAAELPEELSGVTTSGVDVGGPEIMAIGVYLRRHLYQAEKGSQLAPVIVGHAEPLRIEIEEGQVAGAGEEASQPARNGLWGIMGAVGLAAFFGFGGGLWLMRRMSRLENQQRQLRKKSQATRLEGLPKLVVAVLAASWGATGLLGGPLSGSLSGSLAGALAGPLSGQIGNAYAATVVQVEEERGEGREFSSELELAADVSQPESGAESGPESGAVQSQSAAPQGIVVSEGVRMLLEVLPAFDPQRLMQIGVQISQPSLPRDEGQVSVTEAAKLLWSLGRLPQPIFAEAWERDREGAWKKGDEDPVGRIGYGRAEGTAERLVRAALTAETRELLDMTAISLAVVRGDQDGQRVLVVMPRSPVIRRLDEFVNQRVAIEGLIVQLDEKTQVVFGDQVQRIGEGYPADWPVGWRLLEQAGFDCRELSTVLANMRRPLQSDEGRAFYGMLAAAARVGSADRDPGGNDRAMPAAVLSLEDLLRVPEEQVGEWIELDLETARLTRVVIENEEWRGLLGRDEYWQIDAFGALPPGLRIELPVEGRSEALSFQNRFPVSIVVAQLPESLEAEMVSGLERTTVSGAAVKVEMRMVRIPVRMRGFFYRLWSYQSEFVEREGGSQIAPLVVAATIESQARTAGEASEFAWVGWVMGGLLLAALVTVVIVLVRAERKDARIATVRRQRHAGVIGPGNESGSADDGWG